MSPSSRWMANCAWSARRLWREMNVSYRRALQAQFAIHLDDGDIADLRRILDTLIGIEPDADGNGLDAVDAPLA